MEVNFVASWSPIADKAYKNVSAQKVAEEVYALGENPKTEEILEMAKDEDKEIHKLIEWDDTKAAGKYRLWQVRHIMHELQITKIGLNDKKKPEIIGVPMRMFYNLQGEEGYRPTPLIVQNEDLHKKLLMTALSELNAFQTKYSNLVELKPIFDAIKVIQID